MLLYQGKKSKNKVRKFMKYVGNMKNINFRKAEKEDMDELVRLWEEFMEYNLKSVENPEKQQWMELTEDAPQKSRSHFKDQIEQDNYIVLLAENNSEIIGYIVATIEERPPIFKEGKLGIIKELFVKKDYRNEVLGNILAEKAKNWLKEREVNLLKVRVLETNEKADRFWNSLGFENHMKIKFKELSDNTFNF
ncbi:hypothetical protein AKJ61_04715 [candidate division MSBL1 archaeon SCGC-AAA259B11]|uniref:N-acetyltransferase domain-containing protein n=1 Tax=candidate division MSBL1 archaeon SCGC-AAA259B11 TaxID=1698260 RepID=A0A133U2X5_9EURY|nr:hypothetical protein AKJ61_04715 [candidate division MSBL1 archaeon SCGC-AAA259B11]